MSEPTSSEAPQPDRATRNLKWRGAQDYILHVMLDMRKQGEFFPREFCIRGMGSHHEGDGNMIWTLFTKDKLKNRFKSLKKWHSGMNVMLILSGTQWNKESKGSLQKTG